MEFPTQPVLDFPASASQTCSDTKGGDGAGVSNPRHSTQQLLNMTEHLRWSWRAVAFICGQTVHLLDFFTAKC